MNRVEHFTVPVQKQLDVLHWSKEDVLDLLFTIYGLHKSLQVKGLVFNKTLHVWLEGSEEEIGAFQLDLLTFPGMAA